MASRKNLKKHLISNTAALCSLWLIKEIRFFSVAQFYCQQFSLAETHCQDIAGGETQDPRPRTQDPRQTLLGRGLRRAGAKNVKSTIDNRKSKMEMFHSGHPCPKWPLLLIPPAAQILRTKIVAFYRPKWSPLLLPLFAAPRKINPPNSFRKKDLKNSSTSRPIVARHSLYIYVKQYRTRR